MLFSSLQDGPVRLGLIPVRRRASPEQAAAARTRLRAIAAPADATPADAPDPSHDVARPERWVDLAPEREVVVRYDPPGGECPAGDAGTSTEDAAVDGVVADETAADPGQPPQPPPRAHSVGDCPDVEPQLPPASVAAPAPAAARPVASSFARAVTARLEARLPPSLRGGILDPGARAVGALTVVGLVAALVAGAYLWRSRPEPEAVPGGARLAAGPSSHPRGSPAPAPSPSPSVLVDIGGKVTDPGVYRLPSGSRVVDAVEAAGGVEAGGSTDSVNLARPLVDGEKILVGVPRPPGLAGPDGTSQAGAGAARKLDLNTATAEQIEKLPGIGEVLAGRIIEFRMQHGDFDSVADLEQVSGIGTKTRSEIEDEVRV